jgi:hypothetical protein
LDYDLLADRADIRSNGGVPPSKPHKKHQPDWRNGRAEAKHHNAPGVLDDWKSGLA